MRRALTPPIFAALSLFTGLSILMLSGVTLPWDDAVLSLIGELRSPLLTDFWLLASFLADGLPIVMFGLGVSAWLWYRKRPGAARALLFAGLSGEVIYLLAKLGFQRARPQVIEQLAGAGWYSYPSGHTMLATVIYSAAFILLGRSRSGAGRVLCFVLAVVLPLAVACSRVYLGVHYPSDVMAGLALGAAVSMWWLNFESSVLAQSRVGHHLGK